MAQATINVRMDETLKKQLEWLCGELGMSISTAVTIFAKTAVREQCIPFELRIPLPSHPRILEDMTKDEFDAKIQLGLDAAAEGRVRSAKDVFHDMKRKYGT